MSTYVDSYCSALIEKQIYAYLNTKPTSTYVDDD